MITTTYICSNCHSVMNGDAETVDRHVASGECADVRTAAEEDDES